MSAVSTLAARVTALERQVAALRGRAGGGEQLSPNYLTVNAQGQTGALFAGGITVPISPTDPATDANAATFVRPDGTPAGRLYVNEIVGTTGPSVILRADSDPTTNYIAAVLAEAVDSAAGKFETRAVIDSNGDSDFLQLDSSQKLHLALGAGTFTGNGTASVNPTNAINTQLASIVAVAACPKPSPTWGGYLSCVGAAPASLQFAANTNGTFANGTTYSFYYIAIG